MRKAFLSMLAIVLLFMSACADRSGETGQEAGKIKPRKASVKPPKLDIHTATVLGDIDAINQHILAGTDLNEREPTMNSTPLISAAVFGKTEVAKALMEAGADVNLQNNEGSTALHSAAFLCRTEIVKMLLDHGANKDLKNIYGSTPLVSVAGPFEEVKPIYDEFTRNLGSLGFRLDYEQLEATRPVIAEMLR